MGIWKEIVKCVSLCLVFLLVCIFVLWPSSSNQELQLQGEQNVHSDTSYPGEEYNSTTFDSTFPPSLSDFQDDHFDIIDTSYANIYLDNFSVNWTTAGNLVDSLESLLGLDKSSFRDITTHRDIVTFKVEPNDKGWNATEVARRIQNLTGNIEAESGIRILRTDVGIKANVKSEPKSDILDTVDPDLVESIEFQSDEEHNSTAIEQVAPTTIKINSSSTEGFRQALQNAENGTIIQLAAGIYNGQFELTHNNITLKGTGPQTIIHLNDVGTGQTTHAVGLRLLGNNCEIRDLKLISDQSYYTMGIKVKGRDNKLTNIHLEGFNYAVLTHSDNIFSDISVKNGNHGLFISGNNTSLTRLSVGNITGYGVTLNGNNNSVEFLICDNCKMGVYVAGDDNKISQVDIRNSINPENYWKLNVHMGARNMVDQFKCDMSCLIFGAESSNSELRNSTCDRMTVEGTGHTLMNVDVWKLLEVEGSGHRIKNSKAWRFINNGADVILVGNVFDTIEGLL